jgi:hypothetical protein
MHQKHRQLNQIFKGNNVSRDASNDGDVGSYRLSEAQLVGSDQLR